MHSKENTPPTSLDSCSSRKLNTMQKLSLPTSPTVRPTHVDHTCSGAILHRDWHRKCQHNTRIFTGSSDPRETSTVGSQPSTSLFLFAQWAALSVFPECPGTRGNVVYLTGESQEDSAPRASPAYPLPNPADAVQVVAWGGRLPSRRRAIVGGLTGLGIGTVELPTF
jgi:hypothetical protein